MLSFLLLAGAAAAMEPGFVSVGELDARIKLEIRYHGADNFVGTAVDGYRAPKCILSKPAAEALVKAQDEFSAYGMGLRVYDCYRPQRAVDHFVRWAKDLGDTKKKQTYYPRVPKEKLFELGYIAAKSGHSRGSTVDLTIDGHDMGAAWDFFDESAHTANPKLKPAQRRNRLLLKSVMEKLGFKNLSEEWWHYTLREEPYKDRYFDFPVE